MNKTIKGYFCHSYAYAGNIAIHIYDNNHKEIFYVIEDVYNVEGYRHCLEDFGYENKGWELEDEDRY